MSQFKTVADVVQWRLCVGCGACAPICPSARIRLVDIVTEGIRPEVLDPDACGTCTDCLSTCPAVEIDSRPHLSRAGVNKELLPLFGPVLEIWEGHARDPEIRFAGSSGGALTALALHAIDMQDFFGTVHIGADDEDPVRNGTAMSRTREELIQRTGSRYAPAAACAGIPLLQEAAGPCVFIGQPAEAVAIHKAQEVMPALKPKVGLVLSFFCAGSPATAGTQALLRKLGVPEPVKEVRYRGQGWPGHFVASDNEGSKAARITYAESWGFLQKFRPYSVHLWPDDSGEFADISCGDPWYRSPDGVETGRSIIVVRTERGRAFLQRAVQDGYLELTPAEPWKLIQSQRNLLLKRSAVWGRRLAFRVFGLPVTTLRGFPLFQMWRKLPVSGQLKSTVGTMRRILTRGYFRPLSMNFGEARPYKLIRRGPEQMATGSPQNVGSLS